ncbi:MAG: hypothetical protein HY899_04245 [Deltaproteobacteria bacterium]|nr:hypothetical protein [Deltaproteobacteria bacterium]
MDIRTRLERKMRNPAAVLSEDEVTFLVSEARRLLGPRFSDLLAEGSVIFEDQIRWGSVKARCEQVRAERGIDIKAAALQSRIPQYRVVAIESGRLRELAPDLAWRYFDFLGIRAWVRQWIRRNAELATRARISGDHHAQRGGGRESSTA